MGKSMFRQEGSGGEKVAVGVPALIVAASLIILLAGMKAASDLLEPFLLATFISIICAPVVSLLTRKGWPEWLAVSCVMLGLVVVMTGGVALVGASINGFLKQLPVYQAALNDRVGGLIDGLSGLGLELDIDSLKQKFDAGMLMGLAGKVVGGFGAVLGNFLLILLTVAFILLEAARLPNKLQVAFHQRANKGQEVFERFADGVKDYLALKSILSLATGVSAALLLWVLDVDYPLLWGTLAFLFNYIPNIGSFLAAIPACLLAFVLHGSGTALMAMAGYAVINMVFGNVIEPRLMGRSLGLSSLVVFISLVFWGWLLGPVGMVLSVPLTMILRIALEVRDDTRWLAVLLGPEVEPPAQTDVGVSAGE